MALGGQGPWFSDWDYLSRFDRGGLLVLVFVVTPALFVVGICIALFGGPWWLGICMSANSVFWAVAQALSYRKLLGYRRAGG